MQVLAVVPFKCQGKRTSIMWRGGEREERERGKTE